MFLMEGWEGRLFRSKFRFAHRMARSPEGWPAKSVSLNPFTSWGLNFSSKLHRKCGRPSSSINTLGWRFGKIFSRIPSQWGMVACCKGSFLLVHPWKIFMYVKFCHPVSVSDSDGRKKKERKTKPCVGLPGSTSVEGAARDFGFGWKTVFKDEWNIPYNVRIPDEKPYAVTVGSELAVTAHVSSGEVVHEWHGEWANWDKHHGRCEVKFLLEKSRALLHPTAQRTPPTIREAQIRVREVVESDQRVEAVAIYLRQCSGQHVQLQSRVRPTFQYLASPIQRKQSIVCKLEINKTVEQLG